MLYGNRALPCSRKSGDEATVDVYNSDIKIQKMKQRITVQLF